MMGNMNEQVKEYGRKHRFRKRWAKLLGALACVVVLCTTYALILPAITLDRPVTCGLQEHTHGDACFGQVLICGEEGEGHIHTEDCYTTTLTCTLPEHTHSEGCYAKAEEAALAEGQTEKETEALTGSQTGQETEFLSGNQAGQEAGIPSEGQAGQENESPSEGQAGQEAGIPSESQAGQQADSLADDPAGEEASFADGETEPGEGQPEEEAETSGEGQPENQPEKETSAQAFTGGKNDVKVIVDAPEGAFPAGTKMTVGKAPQEAVQAAADAVGAEVSGVKAVDITFTYDGEEIEPAIPISVKLEAALVAQAEEALVVHVDDKAQAEIVGETTVVGETVSFEAGDFSVYAIVDGNDQRYTFHFYDRDGADGQIYETQIIKAGETLAYPSVPDTAEGYTSFDGWYIGGDYQYEDGILTWSGGTKLVFDHPLTAEELEALDTAEWRDGEGETQPGEKDHVIRVWARYSAGYEVIFFSQLPETDPTDPDPGMSQPTVVAQMSVADGTLLDLRSITAEPSGDDLVFKEWVDASGNPVGTSITVQGDTYLYASFAKGYSLVFDANAEDATVTATQYLLEGNKPQPPADPSRPGYTFVHWTLDQEGTEIFDFGQELTENTTVYAQWSPSAANYTLIIWQQKITDSKDAADGEKEYDYKELYVASAPTGAAVTQSMVTNAAVVSSTDETVSPGDVADCTALEFNGFHYSSKAWDSEDEAVASDGSTVINVYYDRDLITMKFTGLGDDYAYTPSNAYDQTMYGLVDGQYVLLTRSGRWGSYSYSYNNQTYSGQRYTRSSETYLVMTGLYGQTLDQNGYVWPTVDNNNNPVNWQYTQKNGSDITTTFMEAFMFPGGETEVTFTRKTAQGNTVRYYTEDVQGNYTLAKELTTTQSNNNFNISDRYTGFHADSYRISKDNGTNWDDWVKVPAKDEDGYYTSISGNDFNILEIRYARNEYSLDFVNGGDPISTVKVKYGADLNQVKADNADNITVSWPGDPSEAEYYEFDGIWYDDPEGQVVFNWDSTMPANDLVVYAVWKPKQFKVTFDANGGIFTDAQGSESEKLELMADYKSRLSDPVHPYLEGCVFLGWVYEYENEDGEQAEAAWTFDTQIMGDVYLTAKWLSEYSLVVAYNVNGDTTQITDTHIYSDGSQAIVTNQIPEGRFVGWRIGEEETIYTAGDSIDVTTENDRLDGTPDTVVTLTAVFDELPSATLAFDPNKGAFPASQNPGADGRYVAELPNNGGVDLDTIATPIRMGYLFVGWSADPSAEAAEFKPDGTAKEEIAVDNIDPENNVLYAVWEELITLRISKVDSADGSRVLQGAQFVLSAEAGGATYYYHIENGVYSWSGLEEGSLSDFTFTTDENGAITFPQSLGKGTTYTLKEIKAPEGYKPLEETITISVTSDGDVTASCGSAVKNDDGSCTVTVKNTAGQALPNTGGMGTTGYTAGGLLLMAVAAAGCLMYSGRRRRKGGAR